MKLGVLDDLDDLGDLDVKPKSFSRPSHPDSDSFPAEKQ